jgi:N-acetylmuramoyl-L-alanine amidase
MKTILIDPGHGGEDSGAFCSSSIQEKDFNLAIGLMLGGYLNSKGIHASYTRQTDNFIPLGERQRRIAQLIPDAVVSIHCNWDPKPQAHGFEIFYRDDDDKKLALCVGHLLRHTGLFERGIFQDVERMHKHLAVLYNLPVPSILVECGFLSNLEDLKYLKENQGAIAEVIGAGVLDYFKRTESA